MGRRPHCDRAGGLVWALAAGLTLVGAHASRSIGGVHRPRAGRPRDPWSVCGSGRDGGQGKRTKCGARTEGDTIMPQQVHQDRTKQFAGKLLGFYTGCALTKLIDIGHQTGLFDAGAKRRARATSSPRGPDSTSGTSASGSAP